ncbi:MAG: hypothetical protein ABI365_05515 [Lysobacteraceae bacterium]
MSHTKLGLAKVTALAVFCAAGLGAAHTANAGGWLGGALNYHGHDGHNHYNISVGFNDHARYGNGYYAPRYYRYARPYYSSYVVSEPVYSYYSAPTYYTSYDPYDSGYYNSGYYDNGYYGPSYYPSSYYSVSYYGGSRGGWYGRDRDDRRDWNGGHGWNGHGDRHDGHDHDGRYHGHGHHP